MDAQSLKDKFQQMKSAYQNLYLGSLELLELDNLFWTEKALLKLVKMLSQKRLVDLKAILAAEPTEFDNTHLRENMVEAQIVAALGGHLLESWEPSSDTDGFQATCSACGGSVFVSPSTIYSILTDTCSSQTPPFLDTD